MTWAESTCLGYLSCPVFSENRPGYLVFAVSFQGSAPGRPKLSFSMVPTQPQQHCPCLTVPCLFAWDTQEMSWLWLMLIMPSQLGGAMVYGHQARHRGSAEIAHGRVTYGHVRASLREIHFFAHFGVHPLGLATFFSIKQRTCQLTLCRCSQWCFHPTCNFCKGREGE